MIPLRLTAIFPRSGPASAVKRDPWLRLLVDAVSHIRRGQCTLVLPGGRAVHFAGQEDLHRHVTLRVERSRMVRRLLLGGHLGLGESYMDGDWDSPDLPALLEVAQMNEDAVIGEAGGLAPFRLFNSLAHRLNRNSRRGSRRNIAAHYDLGNDFYALWLDPELTYSSALFTTDGQNLSEAQDAKYRRLADSIGLQPGMRLLEIGCGWGGFAVMAARDYGCHVTALTLSRAQHAWASAKVGEAGLQDRIDVRLQDYRDVQGSYDRIASIEMFEAVGEAYWPRFFQVLRDRLVPGGIAGLQIISIDDRRFASYRRSADFIQRYIFPGGQLPSPSALRQQITAAGLRLTDAFCFGLSYAETLRRWRSQFLAVWPHVRAMGFDERFKRMWDYYLAYCEAGFLGGTIDVAHYRIERSAAVAVVS